MSHRKRIKFDATYKSGLNFKICSFPEIHARNKELIASAKGQVLAAKIFMEKKRGGLFFEKIRGAKKIRNCYFRYRKHWIRLQSMEGHHKTMGRSKIQDASC